MYCFSYDRFNTCRGGSLTQNLILKGFKTKISAISINDKIDSGNIYLKETYL